MDYLIFSLVIIAVIILIYTSVKGFLAIKELKKLKQNTKEYAFESEEFFKNLINDLRREAQYLGEAFRNIRHENVGLLKDLKNAELAILKDLHNYVIEIKNENVSLKYSQINKEISKEIRNSKMSDTEEIPCINKERDFNTFSTKNLQSMLEETTSK